MKTTSTSTTATANNNLPHGLSCGTVRDDSAAVSILAAAQSASISGGSSARSNGGGPEGSGTAVAVRETPCNGGWQIPVSRRGRSARGRRRTWGDPRRRWVQKRHGRSVHGECGLPHRVGDITRDRAGEVGAEKRATTRTARRIRVSSTWDARSAGPRWHRRCAPRLPWRLYWPRSLEPIRHPPRPPPGERARPRALPEGFWLSPEPIVSGKDHKIWASTACKHSVQAQFSMTVRTGKIFPHPSRRRVVGFLPIRLRLCGRRTVFSMVHYTIPGMCSLTMARILPTIAYAVLSLHGWWSFLYSVLFRGLRGSSPAYVQLYNR